MTQAAQTSIAPVTPGQPAWLQAQPLAVPITLPPR